MDRDCPLWVISTESFSHDDAAIPAALAERA